MFSFDVEEYRLVWKEEPLSPLIEFWEIIFPPLLLLLLLPFPFFLLLLLLVLGLKLLLITGYSIIRPDIVLPAVDDQ